MTKTETLKELLRAMELTTPKNIALRIAMRAVMDIGEPAPAPDPKPAEPKPEPAKRRKGFDDEKLKALWEAKWAVAKIADEMGVSEQTVRNHLVKAGLV